MTALSVRVFPCLSLCPSRLSSRSNASGSCFCANGEVGWCCPWHQRHMCQLRRHSVLTATWSPCIKRLWYCFLPLRQRQGFCSEDTESRQLSRAIQGTGWGECHSREPHGIWTAFLCGTVWTTHGHLNDSSSLQSVHPQTGEATAHHVTASDGHKPLPPRATCSPADVALEGSWPTGTSRCLHCRLWLENRRWDNLPQHWQWSTRTTASNERH